MDWTDRINPQVHLQWSGPWRRGFIEPPRVLADHELVVVASGGCRLEVAETVLDLREGDWVVVPPATAHRSLALGAGCHRHCLHFDWEWTDQADSGPWFAFGATVAAANLAVHRPPAWLPAGLQHGTAGREVVALGRHLDVRWRAGDRAGVRAIALDLLLALFAPRRSLSSADRAAALAWQVKERLDRGGLEHCSLRDELRRLGHSYEHLCRCFGRTFGMPPLRYLTLARIERAKHLLLAPDARVEHIATTLGYRDPTHFSRIFRDVTGLAPWPWRRRELVS